MNKSNKFSPEVRERAVRMVLEHRGEYPSLWAAAQSIAPKIGCVPHTLYEWVRRHEVDTGVRDGVTTAEKERVKELEREVKELRRANEILKLASAFLLNHRFRSVSPRRSSTAV
jgi:transposase-like protein